MKVKSRVVPERHLRKGAKPRYNWKVYVGTRLVRDGVEMTHAKASAKAKKIKKELERKEKRKEQKK